MAKQRPDRLEDLAGISNLLLIRCRKCGREVRFEIRPVLKFFYSRAWSTLLAHAGQRFRCEGGVQREDGCGARDPELRAVRPAPPPPPPPEPLLNSRQMKERERRLRG